MKVCSLSLAVLVLTLGVSAQDVANRPTFEVTSVRPVPDPSGHVYQFVFRGGRLSATNVSLTSLVLGAYDLPILRVVDLPPWASASYFDLEATAPPDTSADEMRLMLRALLRDRFGLRAHMEPREQSIYALGLARAGRQLGPGLRVAAVDCAAHTEAVRFWNLSQVGPRPRRAECDARTALAAGTATMRFPAVVMPDFARLLESFVERVVVDETGLDGRFDVELEVGQDDIPLYRMQRRAGASVFEGPSLVAAVRQQLGLSLESRRGEVEVLAIDALEPPIPN